MAAILAVSWTFDLVVFGFGWWRCVSRDVVRSGRLLCGQRVPVFQQPVLELPFAESAATVVAVAGGERW